MISHRPGVRLTDDNIRGPLIRPDSPAHFLRSVIADPIHYTIPTRIQAIIHSVLSRARSCASYYVQLSARAFSSPFSARVINTRAPPTIPPPPPPPVVERQVFFFFFFFVFLLASSWASPPANFGLSPPVVTTGDPSPLVFVTGRSRSSRLFISVHAYDPPSVCRFARARAHARTHARAASTTRGTWSRSFY